MHIPPTAAAPLPKDYPAEPFPGPFTSTMESKYRQFIAAQPVRLLCGELALIASEFGATLHALELLKDAETEADHQTLRELGDGCGGDGGVKGDPAGPGGLSLDEPAFDPIERIMRDRFRVTVQHARAIHMDLRETHFDPVTADALHSAIVSQRDHLHWKLDRILTLLIMLSRGGQKSIESMLAAKKITRQSDPAACELFFGEELSRLQSNVAMREDPLIDTKFRVPAGYADHGRSQAMRAMSDAARIAAAKPGEAVACDDPAAH